MSRSISNSLFVNFLYVLLAGIFIGCNGSPTGPVNPPEPPSASSFSFSSLTVDNIFTGFNYYNVRQSPEINLKFATAIKDESVSRAISVVSTAGETVTYNYTLANNDSNVIVTPDLKFPITKYNLTVSKDLQSKNGGSLLSPVTITLITAIDSTDKFPRISDSALLTLIQKQTFKYFCDFAHPVSGMARERNTSGDVVTTGGTGFGIMATITAVERGFITRAEGLDHIQKITSFLKDKCTRYHGAFSHWINGSTGATIPFSQPDDGADLVETSLLMQGLLCARQYFNQPVVSETTLRNDINEIWNSIEWPWFQNGQQVLYWHWSPYFGWQLNLQIRGWNEALITYVLAASSSHYSISKEVYDDGWANNGAIKNGSYYYDITLPLGPEYGGPLFFAHYSFLGIDPNGLLDQYADYYQQNRAHTLINYNHCVANPKNLNGYSKDVWGLTASDDNFLGYAVHDPLRDNGVISPTAAISSLPYTPNESMNAIRFFYYQLGDKLWKDYGFIDAFNLSTPWFADSYLAIDQGPQIVMIENYRTGLLWKLFMNCPEIKTGMQRLGFQSKWW